MQGEAEAPERADTWLDAPSGAMPQFAPLNCASAGMAEAEGLLVALLADAARRGATHVHLEPQEDALAVRVRASGLLVEVLRLGPAEGDALVRDLDMMARFEPDLNGTRRGHICCSARSDLPEAAVTALRVRTGERIVLRLEGAGANARGRPLVALGMPPAQAGRTAAALDRRAGLVIVSGPAGSGRSTTLRAMLQSLDRSARDVVAIEENFAPALEGVSQIAAAGDTAGRLRALLPQDPDVVVVENLDDRASVLVAVQAALAGRLVVASVASGDAVEAILALRASTGEPFPLASALTIVLAQRLVRRLCDACREPVQAQGSTSALLGFDPGAIVYSAVGCACCEGTGYSGLTGVFEAIEADPPLRRLIQDGGDAAILSRHAFLNAPNLGSAARALVREGVTTPEEAVRISRGEALVPIC